jgi:hypothetical protein
MKVYGLMAGGMSELYEEFITIPSKQLFLSRQGAIDASPGFACLVTHPTDEDLDCIDARSLRVWINEYEFTPPRTEVLALPFQKSHCP